MNRKLKKAIRSPEEVEKLVTENFKLAVFMYEKHKFHHQDQANAFSLAMKGLMEAAEDYNGRIPFGAYAGIRIRWALQSQAVSSMRQKRGGNWAIHVHLDDAVADDGRALHEIISEPHSEDGFDIAKSLDTANMVRSLLPLLPPVLADIIINRFGINGEEERTLDDVAIKHGFTREGARQIEFRAMETLRRMVVEVEAGRDPSKVRKAPFVPKAHRSPVKVLTS